MDKVLAYPCEKGDLASSEKVAAYIENAILALFNTEVTLFYCFLLVSHYMCTHGEFYSCFMNIHGLSILFRLTSS